MCKVNYAASGRGILPQRIGCADVGGALGWFSLTKTMVFKQASKQASKDGRAWVRVSSLFSLDQTYI